MGTFEGFLGCGEERREYTRRGVGGGGGRSQERRGGGGQRQGRRVTTGFAVRDTGAVVPARHRPNHNEDDTNLSLPVWRCSYAVIAFPLCEAPDKRALARRQWRPRRRVGSRSGGGACQKGLSVRAGPLLEGGRGMTRHRICEGMTGVREAVAVGKGRGDCIWTGGDSWHAARSRRLIHGGYTRPGRGGGRKRTRCERSRGGGRAPNVTSEVE